MTQTAHAFGESLGVADIGGVLGDLLPGANATWAERMGAVALRTTEKLAVLDAVRLAAFRHDLA